MVDQTKYHLLHSGSVFFMGDDYSNLHFCFYMPKEHIISLIASLRENKDSSLDVSASIVSYSYVPDMHLHVYDYQNNILIDASKMSQCFITGAYLKFNINPPEIKKEMTVDDNDDEEEHNQPVNEINNELIEAVKEVIRVVFKPLLNITTAIWALIFTLIILHFI